jgi:hypothetical protein
MANLVMRRYRRGIPDFWSRQPGPAAAAERGEADPVLPVPQPSL